VPLAENHPNSSADIMRIDLTTYQVTTLFTVTYDHVGGLIYKPGHQDARRPELGLARVL
jgi:hypothetical protein